MVKKMQNELSVIQKTYDFILWYIPIINRFPRDHRFTLGERLIKGLYDLLEGLITARYLSRSQKNKQLSKLNTQLDILRYQTRLLFDFQLIHSRRYEYAAQQLQGIGMELGAWLKEIRPLSS